MVKMNFKKQNGITLVALVITIIVLLILAGVTLNIVLNSGIINKSENAVAKYQETSGNETDQINYLDAVFGNFLANITASATSGGGSNPPFPTPSTPDPEPQETTIDKTTTGDGYVGCYADVDGNGTIDGIIYADLLVGKPTGNWGASGYEDKGTYTLTTVTLTEVKDYVVSTTQKTDARFEKSGADSSTYTARYVVSPASTTTGIKDRFYVMGLEDINYGTNNLLSWYVNAGKMNDYTTTTFEDFGKGKDNTTNMLTKWNTTGYGAQDDRDLWKWIKVGEEEENEGWFVPSRGEWSAFAKAFNIDSSNYEDFGLNNQYWASSQFNSSGAWSAMFENTKMSSALLNRSFYVRLSTTF